MPEYVYQDAEESRNWYVHLHDHLGHLHDFLARRSNPPALNYQAEGCEEVGAVMELVERLTAELPKPPTNQPQG